MCSGLWALAVWFDMTANNYNLLAFTAGRLWRCDVPDVLLQDRHYYYLTFRVFSGQLQPLEDLKSNKATLPPYGDGI